MALVEMLCLANSRKRGGRCVAGITTSGGQWVRPIGTSTDGSLTAREYKVQDGSDALVFDLLRVDLAEPRPEPHQPENWVVGKRRLELLARPAPTPLVRAVLHRHIVKGPVLLGSETDRIPYSELEQHTAQSSLALVLASDFEWDIRVPSPGVRRTRANFSVGNLEYNLSVTDLTWEYDLLRLPPGRHPAVAENLETRGRFLLTISLGEPFARDGYCYKLVAAVVPIPPWLASDLQL